MKHTSGMLAFALTMGVACQFAPDGWLESACPANADLDGPFEILEGTSECIPFELIDGCQPPIRLSIEITMEHGQLGHITLELTAPDGDVVTLLDRPGSSADNPDGLGTNLSSTIPVHFEIGGHSQDLIDDCWPGSADELCAAAPACAWDSVCTFAPVSGSFGDLSRRIPTPGTWQLCASVSELAIQPAILHGARIEVEHEQE